MYMMPVHMKTKYAYILFGIVVTVNIYIVRSKQAARFILFWPNAANLKLGIDHAHKW